MSKLIMISSSGLWNEKTKAPFNDLVQILEGLKKVGHRVVCVGSRAAPAWYTQHKIPLQYLEVGFKPTRMSGAFVPGLLKANKGIHPSDVVVLGASDDDFLMAVNSQSVLLRCLWAPLGEKIQNYGVQVEKPKDIPRAIQLLGDKAPWHFRHESDFLNVYSLTQAGTKYEANAEFLKLANDLRACLKDGVTANELEMQLHFASSLAVTPAFREIDVWGFYPSSASQNDGSEVMGRFCTLARTMFKKRGKEPLFLRHKPAARRHQSGGDRTDPSDQIESVCLNPKYADKVDGKSVAVLDDYLTYGASFGVSAALLKKAGAAQVHCVSMGKFGNCALLYEIELGANPYKAIAKGKYNVGKNKPMAGTHINEARAEWLKKFK